MNPAVARLKDALDRIRVRGGERVDDEPTDDLARSVYLQLYARPARLCAAEPAQPHGPLIAARAWTGAWEGDWLYVGASGRHVRLQRADAVIAVSRQDIGPWLKESTQPAPGAKVARFRPGWTTQDGIWTAFGRIEARPGEEASGLRLYFDVAAAGLAPLTAFVCEKLDEITPFTFKIMTAEVDRDRADAAVLYVPSWFRRQGLDAFVGELPGPVLQSLRGGTPLATRELRPGVGMARDPIANESHGLRCARLLSQAARAGENPSARIVALQDFMQQAGMDLGENAWPPTDPDETVRLSDDELIGHLRSARVLPATGNVELVDHTRRNHAWHVVHGQRAVFVKQLRSGWAASRRMQQREVALLSAPFQLDGIAVPVVARIPRAVVFDSRHTVSPVAPSDPAVAAALGAVLGRLHARAPADWPAGIHSLFDDSVAGILDGHRGGSLVRWLAPPQRDFLAQLPAPLTATLDSLARDWQPQRVIHGDVKSDNILSWDDGLRLVDWELADLGDPAWDLGCAWWMCATDEARAALLQAWSARTGRPPPATVVAYAAARGVQDAVEAMFGEPGPTEASEQALARAMALLG